MLAGASWGAPFHPTAGGAPCPGPELPATGHYLGRSALGLTKEKLMFVARPKGYLEVTLGDYPSSFRTPSRLSTATKTALFTDHLPVSYSTTHII